MDEIELAPTQWIYVLARFEGQSITDSARAAGVSRATGTNFESNPDVRAKLAELNRDRVDSIQARSMSHLPDAFQTLNEIRGDVEQSANARINASKALINGAALIQQLFNKEARIRDLEQLFGADD